MNHAHRSQQRAVLTPAGPQRITRIPTGCFTLLRRAQRWGGWSHFAVGLPDGQIVELQPSGFRSITFDEFSRGQGVFLLRALARTETARAATRLQTAFTSRRRYDAIQWNCETFARFVVEGEPRSAEVSFVLFTAVALAALASA